MAKPRTKPQGETALTSAVLAYLKTQPDVWAERRNSGSKVIVAKGVRQYAKWGEPGTPDITGYLHAESSTDRTDGVAIPFGIETKSKTSKLRPSQRAWFARAERFGVAVCVARSISDAKAFIERLRRGDWKGRAA